MFSQNAHKIVILSEAPHRFYRVTQRLGRGVEGPQGYLSYPCCSYRFHQRKPHLGGPPGHGLPCCVISNLCFRLKEHKKPQGESCSRARVSENSKQHRQDKHRRGPSTPRSKRCTPDKSVRRFAQDDDFVGVLKKKPRRLALMGRSPSQRFYS